MSNRLSAREKLPTRQQQCVDWMILAAKAAIKVTPRHERQKLLDIMYARIVPLLFEDEVPQ